MSYQPTNTDIMKVRFLTGENAPASGWTDEQIAQILTDRNGDTALAASDIWTYKAAEMVSSPDKFSVDGGSYEFTEARQRCLDEAARCAAMSPGGMIIDPTLKFVGGE